MQNNYAFSFAVISSFEIENETDFVPVLSPKISVLFPNVDPIYDVVVSKISGNFFIIYLCYENIIKK